MSKKCINCGSMLEDDVSFCVECGTRQPMEENVYQNNESSENGIEKDEPLIDLYSSEPTESNNRKFRQKRTGSSEKQSRQVVENNPMGTAALVFGIISLATLGWLYVPEILAIVFGIKSNRDGIRPGRGTAGIICGILSIVILVIIIVVMIVLSL